MSTLLDAVRAGFYAQKQINSRSRLIAWSHRGRFATGFGSREKSAARARSITAAATARSSDC